MNCDLVCFDFDGTLVLSNQIKKNFFYHVASKYGLSNEEISRLISDSNSRVDFFIGVSKRSGFDNAAMETEYSSLVEIEIKSAAKRPGASRFLEKLKANRKKLVVLSATPQIYLDPLVEHHFPEVDFLEILGVENKISSLLDLCTRYKIEGAKVLMVGDGLDDYAAATNVGTQFIGVSGGSLEKSRTTLTLISSFDEVTNAR